MGDIIGSTACPACSKTGNGNSLKLFDDGKGYCFECQHIEYGVGGVVKMSNKGISKPSRPLLTDYEYKELRSRGISEDVCRKFHYGVGNHNGKPAHIANYYNRDGDLVAQKLRSVGKKISWVGAAKEATLFGMHAFRPDPEKFITITEGEIDALSVAELCKNYPVVSLRNGAGSAKDDIKGVLDYLNGFKYVVLAFDSDEAGKEAAKKCVDLFDPGRVRIAEWPCKDANDMIKYGKGSQIKSILWNAVTLVPKSIRCLGDILDNDELVRPTIGLPWPWQELNDVTYGIQNNSIYTIGAGSGVGKTEFLKDLVIHIAGEQKQKTACLFLETSTNDLVLKLAGGVMGRRLHVPGEYWDESEIKHSLDNVRDNVYLYDIAAEGSSGGTWDVIKHKLRYFTKGLGVKYIVLDHMTAMTCHMTDERREIDKCMAELGALVHELNFTVFLVSHLAKPPVGERTYEQGRPVTAASFRGSQSIQYWSSFIIGLSRNKTAQDYAERNTLSLNVLKDRLSGDADGFKLDFTYNRALGKLEVKPDGG